MLITIEDYKQSIRLFDFFFNNSETSSTVIIAALSKMIPLLPFDLS
jgi:hypothetical protein